MRATSVVLWHPRPLFTAGGASMCLLGAFVHWCGPPSYYKGFPLLQDLQRLTLPPGQGSATPSWPESHGEEEVQGDEDVLSLYAPHSEADLTGGGDGLRGDLHSGSAEPTDCSRGAEGVPVSSPRSRVLSAANILGLEVPTPALAPMGDIWEGVPRATPPPPVPVPPDYTAMLNSSWGKRAQRPQFNAGCRQLAMANSPVETRLGDMPPVEQSRAALTSGPCQCGTQPALPP